jgi:hypothetical protein
VTDEPFRPEGAEVTPDLPGALPSGSAASLGRRAERRRGRRRRLTLGVAAGFVVVAAVAAALVALGSGGGRATKATSRRSTATVASSTTSTTTPTSSVTGTTLIPQSANPAVALGQQYDGRYVGTFTNTTFQTTGPASLDLRVDPSSGVLTATVDLDGDLFGGGAKQVRRIGATVQLGGSNPSVVTGTSAFGPVTGRLGSGLSIVLTAPSVPDAKVKTFELTGTLRSDTRGFDATFTVGFRDGRSAQGTATVLCAPQGQRPSQVKTVCAQM